MKKTITILLILATCVTTTHATSYAHTRMRRSTVLSHRSSFSYGRYSTGIGRHTMDMSDRRMELSRQSDGRQEVRTYGNYPYFWYTKYYPYTHYPERAVAQQPAVKRRSVYTMVDAPARVTGYTPLSLNITGSRSSSSFTPSAPESYRLVTSEVAIGDIVHNNSWDFGFGTSSTSAVHFGRTSNGESMAESLLSSFSFSSATPKQLATTTQDGDSSDPDDIQQFAENPTYDSAPLGDALLPMLLLLSLVTLFRCKFRK